MLDIEFYLLCSIYDMIQRRGGGEEDRKSLVKWNKKNCRAFISLVAFYVMIYHNMI